MFDRKYLKNFDFLILIILFILVFIGSIGIGVAMRPPTDGQEQDIMQAIASFNLRHVNLHFIWFAAGVIAMLVVVSIDYNILSDLSDYIYWAIIIMLIYVDIRGDIAGGAQSWIDFGTFKFQPSEFAKIAVIIALAKVLALKEDGIKSIMEVLPVAVQVGIPLVLIVLQPDFGTAAVIVAIFFGMLFMGGISYKLLAGMITAAGGVMVALWYTFLTEIQQNRILVFLNPGVDELGRGYQVMQSIIAIGSGRIYGKGILDGNMLSQLDFLPAKHTDFIFSVVVEALGFAGGALVILLYLVLIIRTAMIASAAKDKFGSMLAAGVVSMMVFHIFENIGMTMGLMPVTGIPLPFMSYGGSSMLTNMIAYGLVLGVGMRRQKTMF